MNDAVWEWYDDEWKQVSPEDNAKIEDEYQKYLSGKRVGQRVFHCFGDRFSAIINYTKMETDCGSGRCILRHETREGLCQYHMTYKLRRGGYTNDDTQ